jgi:hypothetical protein
MLTPGPKRIILIRAGRYDYAEVVLGQSAHLVGQNNSGKTSLISTLQMLYVANFNEMSFSRPWDETRRYYFRLDTSTILFETVTSDGRFVTVGLRGKGQMGAFQVDRFAFEGAYRKGDFIDETNRVRPFDEVKRRIVADRFFKELEPNEIRAALTGELAIKQLNMGIVPLRDVGRYGDFAYLFKNLLRLNDLNQKDVKDTLLTVYRHGIRNAIEVDLNKEYTDAYSALMVEKAKLANIRQVALIANHLKAEQNKRIRDSRDLPALYAAVVGAKARQRTDLLAGVERDRERLAALEKAAVDAKEEWTRLDKENEVIVRAGIALEGWFKDFDADATALLDYLPDIEAARRKNLAHEIDALTALLVTVGDPADIEARLERTRKKLAATIERRDKHALLLGTRLQERLGQAVMSDLGRIFHPELLRLPLEDQGVTLSDEDALLALLRRIHGKVTDGRLVIDGVSIPLDLVASRESVRVADLAMLNEEVDELNRDVKKLDQDLATAKDMAAVQAKRKGLREALQTSEKLHERFLRHAESAKSLPEQKRAEVEQKDAKEANVTARQDLEKKGIERERQKTTINGDIRAKNEILMKLDNVRPAPPKPSWPIGTPDPEWPVDAIELASLYMATYNRYSQSEAEVLRILQEAELLHPDGFAGGSDDEKVDAIIETVDSVGERDRAYREHLGNVIKGMRATFQRMFEALDSLSDSAEKFSRTIGNVAISNLRGLSVKIIENTEVTRNYRSVVEAGTGDLLSDLENSESAINAIHKTIQRAPVLRLADWFGVQFIVKTADGAETAYNDLAKIESNGTTMAIKALVNIVLIQAMMRDRRPFIIPFYIDEANQIDEPNLREIVALANNKGFCPIFASTVPVAAAESIYIVRMTPDSRAIIDPKSRIERKPKEMARADAA